jgi:NADH-quinone oxidoreductase subunit E
MANTPQTFDANFLSRLDAIIARYPRTRSAIMPMLHLVQAREGFVTAEGIEVIAEKLDLTTAEVHAVASFYTQYRRTPAGEYHVGVCTNTLCAIMGGDAIFAGLKDHLGIENNERTADGKVSLEHIECNAACDYAPVVMVNWEFRGPDSVPTFKEASEVLAGFNDGRANEGVQAGEPTLLGLKIAKGERK